MIYPRKLKNRIKPYLEDDLAIVITGMRRVGKTFLLHDLYSSVASTNKLFLDLEKPENRAVLKQQGIEAVIRDLETLGVKLREKQPGEAGKTERSWIFLDEVQLVKTLPRTIKYLSDHYFVKFVASGSSSFYLKNLFSESLSGRKIVFQLQPLDFGEFLTFKGLINQDQFVSSFPELAADDTALSRWRYSPVFEEYLQTGGFPQAVLAKDEEGRRQILKDILDSYLAIDVRTLSDFKGIDDIEKLIRVLPARIGQKIDISRLSREVGVSRITIKNYLKFLEDTFVISLITPYSKSADREIVAAPKLYFGEAASAAMVREEGAGAEATAETPLVSAEQAVVEAPAPTAVSEEQLPVAPGSDVPAAVESEPVGPTFVVPPAEDRIPEWLTRQEDYLKRSEELLAMKRAEARNVATAAQAEKSARKEDNIRLEGKGIRAEIKPSYPNGTVFSVGGYEFRITPGPDGRMYFRSESFRIPSMIPGVLYGSGGIEIPGPGLRLEDGPISESVFEGFPMELFWDPTTLQTVVKVPFIDVWDSREEHGICVIRVQNERTIVMVETSDDRNLVLNVPTDSLVSSNIQPEGFPEITPPVFESAVTGRIERPVVEPAPVSVVRFTPDESATIVREEKAEPAAVEAPAPIGLPEPELVPAEPVTQPIVETIVEAGAEQPVIEQPAEVTAAAAIVRGEEAGADAARRVEARLAAERKPGLSGEVLAAFKRFKEPKLGAWNEEWEMIKSDPRLLEYYETSKSRAATLLILELKLLLEKGTIQPEDLDKIHAEASQGVRAIADGLGISLTDKNIDSGGWRGRR